MKKYSKLLLLILFFGFLLFHIFSSVVLRFYFGWKELFLISYIFLVIIFILQRKKKISDISFILLAFLPFVSWTFSHLVNLIKHTPYGWVSIIFSIYFFVPYVILAGILLKIVITGKVF